MKGSFFVAASLLGGAFLLFSAPAMAHGPGGFFPERVMSRLTEQQRAEVTEMVDEMREAGASSCEIHDAVRQKVEGYGIELPEPPGLGLRHITEQLSEDQRREVRTLTERMWAEGAAPCEILDSVRDKVEGYGIELPEPPGFGLRHMTGQLSEDQRGEVRDLARQMWAEGASACDIRDAVRRKVESFGVEPRDFPGFGLRRVAEQLTEDQRAEVRQLTERMWEEGASPCEIHDAVRRKVESFGVEMPEGPGGRRQRDRHAPQWVR
jgi:hypothetical protein